MEGGGGRAFPRRVGVGTSDQWGRTAYDTRCQGREERQLCSPPRVAAGIGRESPSAELGVPRCCTPALVCCCTVIWEGKSFNWLIPVLVGRVSKLCWEAEEKQ